ncbi:hypothetical protein [Actinocatenispora sera]|uniref:DUF2550 family protein n=1 Tax=Actinocatenispora sera TaxID=390989 RepID=A0A810KYK4_9ACTN|nr:hypothetical protein [Actinocatenispora sera]BCJ27406.1 hypothetical protein Asera_15140 [Actinocatenispora sera]
MHLFLRLLPILIVLLALLALLVFALVAYGRRMVRNQRTMLADLRRDGLAFLCRPTLGLRSSAGFVLAADRHAVSLWKVGLRQPVRLQSFPSRGARVEPATVRINTARRAAGLSVVSAAGERLDVVVYPDPTMSYSSPTKDALLDRVSQQLQAHLSQFTTD